MDESREAPLLKFSETGEITPETFKSLCESCELSLFLAALTDIPSDIPESSKLSVQVGKICRGIDTVLQNSSLHSVPGVLELCLAVLLQHTKDERVIHGTLSVLVVVMPPNEDVQNQFCELKGPQLVIRSMISTRTAKPVQIAGSRILLELTTSERGREVMGQFFAIEVVLSSLKAFNSDPELQRIACAFIANMGYRSPKNKERISQNGGIKAILRIMKKQKDSAVTTTWATLALRNMTKDNFENQEFVFSAGVIRLLLTAILQYKDNEKVVVHAVAVLFHLVDGKNPSHAAAAQQMVEFRGIDIIVRSMRAFRAVSTLHLCCVGCFRAIAHHGGRYAQSLLAGGALEAALSSMIAYRTMEELQANGIELMRTLGTQGEEVRLRIISAGGLNTISISLKTHIANEAMMEVGATTLLELRSTHLSN